MRAEGGAPGSCNCATGGPVGPAFTSFDDLPPLLLPDEAAILLRTTRKAVYSLAERGQIPGVVRIGRRLLIERDPLVSWLHRSRAASPKEVNRRWA